jgi:5,10-methylene-tetrahydrofolate dehydrogenase/methenyl tetrahydrofolate cyclohydrolase
MSATILDGKALAEKIIQESKRKTNILKPTLAVIIVGNDPASKIYVRN